MDMETFVTILLFLSLFGLNSSYRKHIYVKDKMNGTDAQEYCRKNYDYLSTVTSQDLQTFCQNSEIKEDYFYCGLQRDIQNSQWKWSDGTPATINEWDVNQGTKTGENCVAVRKSNAKLHDFDCNEKLPFYCMLDLELVLESKIWEEALDYCKQYNTGLASLSTSTIMELAVNMATEAQTVNIWTGLRFLVGHWFWVNGGDFGYKAWSEERELQCPAMNQRCGSLDRDRKVWNPQNCQERLNFFCFHRRK